MKIKLVAAASALAFCVMASANAADLVRQHALSIVKVKPKPLGNISWAGFYAGAQGGYKTGKQQAVLAGITHDNKLDYDIKGGAGGAYAGFNSAVGHSALVGVETDMFWDKLKANHDYKKVANVDYATNLGLREKWSGATRVRLGFTKDRLLPYLSGGVAYSRLSGDDKSNDKNHEAAIHVAPKDGDDKTYVGWTAGAGVDYAAAKNLLLRLEYRYSDYGKKDFNLASGGAAASANVKYDTHDVRVGVAYKF